MLFWGVSCIRDVYFMKGIKNVEALREVVRKGEMTSEYWGDEWAIATLELILNVKFIVLSSIESIIIFELI